MLDENIDTKYKWPRKHTVYDFANIALINCIHKFPSSSKSEVRSPKTEVRSPNFKDLFSIELEMMRNKWSIVSKNI